MSLVSVRRPRVQVLAAAVSVAAVLAACSGGGETPVLVADDGRLKAAGVPSPSGTGPSAYRNDAWSPVIPVGLTPGAMVNLPNGKVLMWSGDRPIGFQTSESSPAGSTCTLPTGTVVTVLPGFVVDPRAGVITPPATTPAVPACTLIPQGGTYYRIFDPATGLPEGAAAARVATTQHNMFCPGTTNLADGRVMISGGIDASRTTIYDLPLAGATGDAAFGRWAQDDTMEINRAYQANTITADGSVFTLGGSWWQTRGGKDGEIWTPPTGAGAGSWRRLPGVPVQGFIGADPADVTLYGNTPYRGDNHMWLKPTANGRILHVGPHTQMNWISTRGDGAVISAGPRGNDVYSILGNAVMYEPGKILKVGGAASYDNGTAFNGAYLIDTNVIGADQRPQVTQLPNMAFTRAFHNSVVLPNGQVFIVGGQNVAKGFSDDGARAAPELFDPIDNSFTTLPDFNNSVPIPGTSKVRTVGRNYHSSAVLLPDARVLVGGGGLGGARSFGVNGPDDEEWNHPDVQIYTPHYLRLAGGGAAPRPTITAPAAIAPRPELEYGSTLAATTDTPVTSWALVRMGSATHGINNDQRRIPLTAPGAPAATSWTLQIPTNPNIALPGIYMLFALNAQGTPSVARIVKIGTTNSVVLENPDDRAAVAGVAISPISMAGLLRTQRGAVGSATASAWTVANAATGTAIPWLSISGAGVITGTPPAAADTRVIVTATSTAPGAPRASTEFYIRATATAPTTGPTWRFVRLVKTTATNGQEASMAEFNLITGTGALASRAGWVATATTEESSSPASDAIDGLPSTMWHSRFTSGGIAPPPHDFVVQLGVPTTVGGFRYLRRQDNETRDGYNGARIGQFAEYNFFGSNDRLSWTLLSSGNLLGAPVGADGSVTVANTSGGPTTLPPTMAQPATQETIQGSTASLQIQAADPNAGTVLSYSATGLPPGLTISPSTGLISGTVDAAAPVQNYSVTVTVADGPTGTALTESKSFIWIVTSSTPTTPGSERFVKLVVPTKSAPGYVVAADIRLLTATGADIAARTGWTATASSTASEFDPTSGPASAAIDVSRGTFWHTQFISSTLAPPHELVINMGSAQALGGLCYLPRQDADVGTPTVRNNTLGDIESYEIFVSATGAAGTYRRVASGTFTNSPSVAPTVPPVGNPCAGYSVARWNTAPLLTAPSPLPRSERGTALSAPLQIAGSDVNGNTFTCAFTGLPTGLTADAANCRVSGTPTALGTFAVQVVATDNGTPAAQSAPLRFNWEVVAPPNRAPTVISSGAVNTSIGTTLTNRVIVQASDPDNNALTYSATGLPSGLTMDTTNGQVSGTVGGTVGSPTVTVTVSDGQTPPLTASVVVPWTVTAQANRAPTFGALAPLTATIADSISRTVTASDLDGDALTYGASGLPTGLSINTTTGLISGEVARSNVPGNVTVNVTANDGRGGTATGSFVLTLTAAANRAPTITTPAAQTVSIGTGFSLQVAANDPDSDALTYVATNLPTGLAINASTGLISGNVAASNAVASRTVGISVSDSRGGTASASFSLNLTAATNRVPTITAPPATSTAIGAAVNLGVAASDADGDTLTYAATNLPEGLSINASTGLVTGTVAAGNAVGVRSVTVSATDGRSTAVTASFDWTITAAAVTPPVEPPVTPPAAGGGGGGGALGLQWLLALGLAAGALRRARSSSQRDREDAAQR